ncbi:MAG: transglutaminase domain-containing protein [Actinomycetota bacterium]
MMPEAPVHTELQDLEEHALEHLAEQGLPTEESMAEAPVIEEPIPVLRMAFVVGFPVIAAAVMAGGIFIGVSPRFFAAVAGVLGLALGVYVRRIKQPVLINVAIVGGIILIGVIVSLPAGSMANILDLGKFIKDSVQNGGVRNPPVAFDLGWHAILGWMMASLGFAAAWVGLEMRRPAIGIMASLPVVMITAITVPDSQKLASGIACLVLFVIGLALLSGADIDSESEKRSLAFEIRRAAKALPIIAAITGALFLLGQTSILFPPTVYDPSKSANKPKYIPLTDVPDRVLFTVASTFPGPWRTGSLDVYENNAWRLPPPGELDIGEVPADGIVDSELSPGILATFKIEGLTGVVLPGLSNPYGVVASGPVINFDKRNSTFRLAEGSNAKGLEYTVVGARIPSIDELKLVTAPPPKELAKYLEIPPPPPAVVALLAKAPKTSPWDTLDFVRNSFLDVVIADGEGRPKDVPPSRVQDMLAGSKKGTPYEIVAAQAMLARWAGVPSRMGYGFDGGNCPGTVQQPTKDHPCSDPKAPLEVRPKQGASFMEVYFPTYKWLPVLGQPRQSTSNLSNENTQQNQDLLASDDISVKVFFPIATDPARFLFEQIRYYVLIALPIIFLLLAMYFAIPVIRKLIRRSKRRAWAMDQGFPQRIGVAYAEFRDLCMDLGYRFNSDTPLMFLDRVVPDDEHTEFAWLVTRCLWGDLQNQVTIEDALAAEELSRTMRKRLGQAHAVTLRVVAAVSRLSLKQSYAPGLNIPVKSRRKDSKVGLKHAA